MASKEMTTIASTSRIRAKKPCVGRHRPDLTESSAVGLASGSASCQPASITNGISSAVSRISTTAMPSTPSS